MYPPSFSFFRSPSYPPPGYGKNKSKLKPEQDGISKTHKLLRRTCSSTVKAEDTCVTKSHRTFGRSLSSDPRAEHTMTIKSHKLLNHSCSAAIKQDECITLKPHKLLSRPGSGDTRCEHNSTLKPHKLLSRSYSSNLRMDELDGLKNHKLLSKSYSSAPKSSKMELFKEPTIAEGRRLSLTSGLIGILTPSSSSPSQSAVRNQFYPVSFLFSFPDFPPEMIKRLIQSPKCWWTVVKSWKSIFIRTQRLHNMLPE